MPLVEVLSVTYRCGTSVYKPSAGMRTEGTVRVRINGPCLDCYDSENRPEFRGYLTCPAWESMTDLPAVTSFPSEVEVPIYASPYSATGVVSWTAQHCSGGDEIGTSSVEVLVDTAKPAISAEVESLNCDPWQVVVRVALTRAESWRYVASSQSVDSGTLAVADGACSFSGQTVTLTGSLTDTITIEATNANGTTSTTFALTPVTASGSIAASPTTVEPGEPVTLTWSVTCPTGELVGVDAEIDNGVGPVFSGVIDGPESGTVTVWPLTSTTYTLTVGSDCVSRTYSVTVTVTTPDPGTSPWITGQTHRLPFTVQRDHISADLTSHRLLVVIDDEARGTDLGSWCAADGSDVFFAGPDGTTVLSRQLIAFSVTSGKALGIWRLTVASILAAEDVTIYAYCGATSPTSSNPSAVWTGHAGVFPLDETSGATATNLIGSNHGTYVGSLPNAATGVIAGCQYFNGTAGNYINAGNIGATSTSITLSAWVKWDAIQDATPVIATKRDSGCNWALAKSSNSYGGSTNNLTFSFHAAGYWRLWHTTNANLQADTWYFIVVTYNGTSNPKVYVNGVLCSGFWNTSQPWYAAGPVALASGTDPVQIGGRMDSGEPDPHYGWIDDVRILTGTVLPQAFAEFEYYNATEADHELTFLPMQTLDVRTPTSADLAVRWSSQEDVRTPTSADLAARWSAREDVRTPTSADLAARWGSIVETRVPTSADFAARWSSVVDVRIPTSADLAARWASIEARVPTVADFVWRYRILYPDRHHIYARNLATGVVTELGAVDADASPLQLVDVPLAPGTYEVWSVREGLYWKAARKPTVQVVTIADDLPPVLDPLPTALDLAASVSRGQTTLTWTASHAVTVWDIRWGLWFAPASPVDTSGPPAQRVAAMPTQLAYQATRSQQAPEYVALAAIAADGTKGTSAELYLPWSTTPPASPPNQTAQA
jgi:hypothetical protein